MALGNGPFQTILLDITRPVVVAHQGPRIASPRRDRGLDGFQNRHAAGFLSGVKISTQTSGPRNVPDLLETVSLHAGCGAVLGKSVKPLAPAGPLLSAIDAVDPSIVALCLVISICGKDRSKCRTLARAVCDAINVFIEHVQGHAAGENGSAKVCHGSGEIVLLRAG
jgi:hypothetical protein